jgi:GMP synthase (glutamine-hydrolysing)
VKVLAIVHGTNTRADLFGDVIRDAGHELIEWNATLGNPPPPADGVIVFGGAMHPGEEQEHPWLRGEDALIRSYLQAQTPFLGVCLGGQLLAKAASGRVGWARQFEIGWHRVELTDAASDDPLFARLPRAFDAYQSHYHAFEVPDGAVELARNDVCSQAIRVGKRAWGVQFHPEVSLETIGRWLVEDDEPRIDAQAILAESRRRIAAWNDFGRTLCSAFLEVADARTGAERERRSDPLERV